MKIVIDQKIPFIKGALDSKAEVIYLPAKKIDAEAVKDADALVVRTRTKCNAELLKGSKVKYIATATIGYDHIDTRYCTENQIAWSNAPGCNSASVQQYVVSALLYLAEMDGFDLKEKKIGIIGVGNVGSKVARAARALGMEVLLNDPPRAAAEGADGFVDLVDLVREADIITLHVPLNRSGEHKTLGMVNGSFQEIMKTGAILINTSRGEVINEASLLECLCNEKLKHAVLDVFQDEPRVNRELLSKLTLATPHIAGYSTDGKANGSKASVQAISKFFNLGMDSWEPGNLPMPNAKELNMDSSDNEKLDILSEIFAQTYSVQEDHDRFMDQMDRFEQLRDNYRIRREPSAYSLRLFNDDGTYRKIFEGLGFNVLADSCF